jgi:hypothetical protein
VRFIASWTKKLGFEVRKPNLRNLRDFLCAASAWHGGLNRGALAPLGCRTSPLGNTCLLRELGDKGAQPSTNIARLGLLKTAVDFVPAMLSEAGLDSAFFFLLLNICFH